MFFLLRVSTRVRTLEKEILEIGVPSNSVHAMAPVVRMELILL